MRKSHAVVGIGVLSAFLACGGDDGGSSASTSLATTCARVCVRLKAATCAGDNPNTCMDTCMTEATSFPSGCSSQTSSYLACISGATYTCDAADHQGQPSGCDSQTSALASCVQAMSLDAGTSPQRDAATPGTGADAGTNPVGADSGTSARDGAVRAHDGGLSDPLGEDSGISVSGDGGLQQCFAKDQTDSCQVCSAGSCCAEISACDSECGDVIDCTSACDAGDPADSTTCYQACADAATQAGVDEFNAIADCLDANCNTECF